MSSVNRLHLWVTQKSIFFLALNIIIFPFALIKNYDIIQIHKFLFNFQYHNIILNKINKLNVSVISVYQTFYINDCNAFFTYKTNAIRLNVIIQTLRLPRYDYLISSSTRTYGHISTQTKNPLKKQGIS